MAQFKKIPLKQRESKIIYGAGIVDEIVKLAVSELENVELCNSSLKNDKVKGSAIKVTVDKDGVHVQVEVKIHYNQCVSDVAFKIQEAVRHNVEAMTEYHVASVNVVFDGVSFDD